MAISFTPRQGQYLSFIHRFTLNRGMAPSFEQIGAHFGTTPPSVCSMIKILERRGLLSRVPGVPRSLRVLIAPSTLPETDFGTRAVQPTSTLKLASVSPVDTAVATLIAALNTLLPYVSNLREDVLIQKAIRTSEASLKAVGMARQEVLEAVMRMRAAFVRQTSGQCEAVAFRSRRAKRNET
jgi:SOS-response transcriptional repressor LexA